MDRFLFLLVLVLFPFSADARSGDVSGTDAELFDSCWFVESEAEDYVVCFCGDTVDVVAPAGLTLWRRECIFGDVTIEYDASVVVEGVGDRLSDLNCFWMASDPVCSSVFDRADWRRGIFARCYSLRLYYVGFGGNYNTTTRFRRYNGDEEGVNDVSKRPAILREYTDGGHLLEANRWYHIKIVCRGGRVCFSVDGVVFVDFVDGEPLKEGWFGFRTTLSHVRLTNFSYFYH